MGTKLKEINYRGGIIRFKVPISWIEEYEEEGGGTFYEDSQDSGTLRINILTFKTPDIVDENSVVKALSAMSDVDPTTIVELKNGNAIARTVQRNDDQGEKITLYWWLLANAVPPNHVRIANCSYTILTAQEELELYKDEIKLLDKEIQNAIFHPEL
jgi:hypothetical protein